MPLRLRRFQCHVMRATLIALLVGDGYASEFNVVFTTAEPLGLRLASDLSVQGFHRTSPSQRMPSEASGWIAVGDTLIAVNGRTTVGRSVSEVATLIASAALPKELRFSARGGEDRAAIVATSAIAKGHSRMHGHTGIIVAMRDGLSLGTASFLQAQFGGQLRCEGARLREAKPHVGCGAYYNALDVVGAIVIVTRGSCTFVDKGVLAQAAGAVALIIVDDVGSNDLISMPGADTDGITIPVVMISATDGAALRHSANETFSVSPTLVRFEQSDGACTPKHRVVTEKVANIRSYHKEGSDDASSPDYDYTAVNSRASDQHVDDEFASGSLVVYARESITDTNIVNNGNSGDAASRYNCRKSGLRSNQEMKQTARFEFIRAAFGAKHAPPASLAGAAGLRLTVAHPSDACAALSSGGDHDKLAVYPGTAVLAERGGCSFATKLASVAAAGGSMLIMSNTEVGISVMEMANAEDKKLAINDVAAIMVTRAAGAHLRILATECNTQTHPVPGMDSLEECCEGPSVQIVADSNVLTAWAELASLPLSWPTDETARRKLYMKIARNHHPDRRNGSSERFEVLVAAYVFVESNANH